MSVVNSFLHDLRLLPRDLKLLAVSVFLWGVGDALFINIVPLYLKQLGAAPAQIGLIYGLAAASIGLATLPAGMLSDRWGRKPVMLISWAAGLAAVAIMAAAPNLTSFALGWVAYWFTGFAVPAMSSYIANGRGSLPTERALTIVYAGFALGTVFSPAVGGWLGAVYGLRLLFLLAAIMIALSTAALALLRPQPVVPSAPDTGFRSLFNNRPFMGFCGLISVTWFVMWLGMPLAPNFLQEVRGFSVAQIGLLGSIDAVGSTVMSLVLGRRPPRRGFMAAQVLVGVYVLILLMASSFGLVAAGYFVRSAGSVARSLAEAVATRIVARSQWGQAFGVIETISMLGKTLAPLVAGRLYEGRPAWPFQLSLVLLPVSLALAYFFMPRARHAGTDDQANVVHPQFAPATASPHTAEPVLPAEGD